MLFEVLFNGFSTKLKHMQHALICVELTLLQIGDIICKRSKKIVGTKVSIKCLICFLLKNFL